ncbi:hypothetical protein HH_1586 [Helicobacter hepaticus ATCC 51449]|uniref:Uncharacterized protein n=1 Tax=Helicobacter hepaticus (strain ATCC 51449 / 3B1) TaxID=235279 RepID=Q7VFT9_HELHP|nr:hypothetical protein HH_1586 [Helicobacter hepaticus ATCC 51449]
MTREQAAFKRNLMKNTFLQDRFANYLPKWIKIV